MYQHWKRTVIHLTLGLLLAGIGFAFASQAKVPADSNGGAGRFAFTIIESFDAKYLGDTPGHRGRNGGLENTRPHVSLGDPVFRDELQVGSVAEIVWERTKGSLEIEVDPAPLQRISIGDTLWVMIAQGDPSKESR